MGTDMTREEAIKELRGFIGQLTEGCQEAIKVLIPELAESEDERIRKAVLKGIEYLEMDEGWDSIGDIDILDAKQWLEKKKESLHISETCKENTDSFTDEDEDRTINGCLLAANAERRCKRASEELLEELGLADYTKFFYEQGVEKGKKEREKPKEQKPAEWSDTDNIGWDEAFACVTKTEEAAKNEEELQNAVTAEKWLKEIKFKYYVHPVKQEWSEQDIQYYDAVMDMITNALYLPCRPRDEIVEWFKSLKNRGNFLKSNTNSPIKEGQR